MVGKALSGELSCIDYSDRSCSVIHLPQHYLPLDGMIAGFSAGTLHFADTVTHQQLLYPLLLSVASVTSGGAEIYEEKKTCSHLVKH